MLVAVPCLAGTKTILLSVGEQKIIPVGSAATKVLVGNPSILSVRKLDSNRILLFGREAGSSEVTIVLGRGSDKYIVRVASSLAKKFLAECGALMEEPCSYLQASVVAGKVVVTGVVADVETYDKVRKIRKAFVDVNFLLEVQPRVLDVLIPIINQEFKKAGLKQARVVRVGSLLVIEGLVEDEREKRRAEIIVEEYYGKAAGVKP